MAKGKQYSPEVRERAVRLVFDRHDTVPRFVGFRTTGDSILIPITASPDFPVLSIITNPSSLLSSALALDCGDDPTQLECNPGTGPGGGYNPGGYWLSRSYSQCSVYPGSPGDTHDHDGLLDECEVELTKAFAPGLRFHAGETHWGRTPHVSVRRGTNPGPVDIFSLLAYHVDPGWMGLSAHDGDSECIIVGVRDYTGTGRWVLEYVTYSAHWASLVGDRSSIRVPHTQVEYSDVYCGRPRVWVSRGKHANYPSQHMCNDGRYDDCSPSYSYDVYLAHETHWDNPVNPRNIGSKWSGGIPRYYLYPNCARGPHISYTECFWSDSEFRGWQSEDGPGATGYKVSLLAYSF
jgi:hypothetical protein